MKELPYHSKFHEFLSQTISDAKAQQLPDLMGCSPHRRTSILKRPEVASHDEVLFFSKLLGQPVAFLLETYRLGESGLTEREKKLHLRIREYQAEPVLSE